METVRNEKELGEAMAAHRYPIRVLSKELVGCNKSLLHLSRLAWVPVLASLGAVLVVFGGPQVFVLTAIPGIGQLAGVLAAAGGGVALAVVGIDVTMSAVKIATGAKSPKILGKIRSRRWESTSDDEGVLS